MTTDPFFFKKFSAPAIGAYGAFIDGLAAAFGAVGNQTLNGMAIYELVPAGAISIVTLKAIRVQPLNSMFLDLNTPANDKQALGLSVHWGIIIGDATSAGSPSGALLPSTSTGFKNQLVMDLANEGNQSTLAQLCTDSFEVVHESGEITGQTALWQRWERGEILSQKGRPMQLVIFGPASEASASSAAATYNRCDVAIAAVTETVSTSAGRNTASVTANPNTTS